MTEEQLREFVKRGQSAQRAVDALTGVKCSADVHHWHKDADAEGDTCNCGAWYRFADRIERTPR